MRAVEVATVLASGLLLVRAAVPELPGYKRVWYDEFDGPAKARPNPEEWMIDLGHGYPDGPDNWGTQEVQEYTDDEANIGLSGEGALRIYPLKRKPPVPGAAEWTSGRIQTKKMWEAKKGQKMRIEGNIHLPAVDEATGAGYWPAFWTLSKGFRDDKMSWPGTGEIDVMENVNGKETIWNVMHCGAKKGGTCDETNGIGNGGVLPPKPDPPKLDYGYLGHFHTYTLEIDLQGEHGIVRWMIDGDVTHEIKENEVADAEDWRRAVLTPRFILLNVAMGGAFADGVAQTKTPTDATVPAKPMIVDYVAVYYKGEPE